MAAKDTYSTNLGLSVLPEVDQYKYPEIWNELYRIRNALRVLQGGLDSYTGALSEDSQYWDQTPPESSFLLQNLTKVYAVVGESMIPGQVVYFPAFAATLTAYKANATIGGSYGPAQAFFKGPAGATVGSYGEFSFLGLVNITGLTVGCIYYLDAISGYITLTDPSAGGTVPGYRGQVVGQALSTTQLFFNPTRVV